MEFVVDPLLGLCMAMIGDKYVLTRTGRSDHDRLRVISEIHDGSTRELLVRAGSPLTITLSSSVAD